MQATKNYTISAWVLEEYDADRHAWVLVSAHPSIRAAQYAMLACDNGCNQLRIYQSVHEWTPAGPAEYQHA